MDIPEDRPLTHGKCTVYFHGMMGVTSRLCGSAKVWRAPYAQHDRVLFVELAEKGKRTAQRWRPVSALILDGHDTPETVPCRSLSMIDDRPDGAATADAAFDALQKRNTVVFRETDDKPYIFPADKP